MSEINPYNRFPNDDFPPAPWSWSDNNGYNSSTYIFCGAEPKQDMCFLEIPDDCQFMAIDEDKLAAFIVEAVNSHASLTSELDQLREAMEEIVNPVEFMRRRSDASSSKLDGLMAIALAKDPEYLRAIARSALATMKEGSANG